MIYLTITTRNRFWHCALSLLALVNSRRPEAFVHLVDDATGDGSREAKTSLVDDLIDRGIINRADWRGQRGGYNASLCTFCAQFLAGDFTHWVHLDDDLVYAAETLEAVLADLDRFAPRDLLFVFVNRWCQPGAAIEGTPLRTVPRAGGAGFALARGALASVGNPFDPTRDPLAPLRGYWHDTLAAAGSRRVIRYDQPYRVQHTANDRSLIFGHDPSIEHLWSVDYRTGKLIDVPEFPTYELRSALAGGYLDEFTRAANDRLPHKIKLPN